MKICDTRSNVISCPCTKDYDPNPAQTTVKNTRWGHSVRGFRRDLGLWIFNKFGNYPRMTKLAHRVVNEKVHNLLRDKSTNTCLVLHILESGLDNDKTDEWGMTPLHVLMQMSNFNKDSLAIKFFSKAAHNLLDTQDNFGRTPLHIGILFRNNLGMHYLIDAGCKMNIKDNMGDLPLHLAAKHLTNGLIGADIEKLIKSDTTTALNDLGSDNKTALELATEAGNRQLINILGNFNSRRFLNMIVPFGDKLNKAGHQIRRKLRGGTNRLFSGI